MFSEASVLSYPDSAQGGYVLSSAYLGKGRGGVPQLGDHTPSSPLVSGYVQFSTVRIGAMISIISQC